MNDDDLDTIESILKRNKNNNKYVEGLIKGESAHGHTYTKEEIEQQRKVNQEFIKTKLNKGN
jgi:hypothetical protein